VRSDSVVEEWSAALGAFAGLVPVATGDDTPTGTLTGTSLGSLQTWRMSGSPQMMRRTPAVARDLPDLIKVCVPMVGTGVMWQAGHQVRIGPGEMVLYETTRAFDAVLEQPWTFAVMAFDPGAMPLPRHFLRRSLRRPITLTGGPGAVLAGFVYATVRQGQGQGLSMGGASARIGEAGLHLLAATLGETHLPDDNAAADAQRIRVLQYIGNHLSDPDLTHDRVAEALHIAPRTLHRLFEDEPYTVTEHIRRQRLESARRDLADPLFRNRSIAGVAARWGFLNQAHFTRAFQSRYGMTPSAIRPRELRQIP
jgi:AraC-like DNA-binding protein